LLFRWNRFQRSYPSQPPRKVCDRTFAEGSGLLFLAGMANGVRFFAPPYWKIDACAQRAGRNPYYEGQ